MHPAAVTKVSSTPYMGLCPSVTSHILPRSALLYSGFLLLANSSLESLTALQVSSGQSLARCLRFLLTSRDPDDQYTFLSCLECLEPSLWAGTASEFPAAFEAREVECVMQLLDSADRAIRRKVRVFFLKAILLAPLNGIFFTIRR